MDAALATGVFAIAGTIVGVAGTLVANEIHDRREARERRRHQRMELYDQLLSLSEIPESEMVQLWMGEELADGRLKALLDDLERAQHLAVVHGAPPLIIECLEKLALMLLADVIRSEPRIEMALDMRQEREKLSRLCAADIAKYD